MNEYQPDCWVVVRMINGEDTIDKVLASFYGGYLSGDSWKLSSGITSTEEFDDRYEFMNYSGSKYICYKSLEKMSGIAAGVYANWEKQYMDFNEKNPDKPVSIDIISCQDIIPYQDKGD